MLDTVASAVIPVVGAVGAFGGIGKIEKGFSAGLDLLGLFIQHPLATLNDVFDRASDTDLKLLKEAAANLGIKLPAKPDTKDKVGVAEYVKSLNAAGKALGDINKAFEGKTKTAQAPSKEVAMVLEELHAQDPTFNALKNEISELNGRKELFAQDLARTTQSISDTVKQITADYMAADAFNTQLSNVNTGLQHATIEYVKQMERNARDRLLKYQYYMAKAFEYEMLQPYEGSFQLNHLFTEITRLLNLPIPGMENWLDNPANFASLKAIYESDLSDVADLIWTNLNANGPRLTGVANFRLTPSQIEALSTQGELTINLVDMGFISPLRQNAKILHIGVSDIVSTLNGPFAQQAELRFQFEHSGISLVQSQGSKFFFQHYTSNTDTPITWATDYDAIRNRITQAEVSPSLIASIAALIGLDPLTVSPDDRGRLFAHPSAWADVTIRLEPTVQPFGVEVDLKEVWVMAKYDSDGLQPNTVVLDVRSDDEMSPQILLNKADHSQRTDGRGTFTRFFNQGQTVTLTAEPTYGRFVFEGWKNAAGQPFGTNPTLTLALNQNTQIRATYALPGDYNRDGTVDVGDYADWRSTFGSISDLRADGNRNGEVDAADYVIWRKNSSQTYSSLLGDYNGNGTVDGADFVQWRKSTGANVVNGTGADGNGNGVIDVSDYEVWRANFGRIITVASDNVAIAATSSAMRITTESTSSESIGHVASASSGDTGALIEPERRLTWLHENLGSSKRWASSTHNEVERPVSTDTLNHDNALLSWLTSDLEGTEFTLPSMKLERLLRRSRRELPNITPELTDLRFASLELMTEIDRRFDAVSWL